VHNVLDAYISITWGSGRGLALEFSRFLGPVKWHRADRQVPFHRCKGCFKHKSPLVTFTGCILGRSRAHNCGEWRSRWIKELNSPCLGHPGELRNLTTLLHPSYSPPPPLLFSPSNSAPSLLPHWLPTRPHPPSITYWKSTANCKVHKGTLQCIKHLSTLKQWFF
jgi:hypothetical protein